MFRGTSAHPHPQSLIPPVSTILPYPPAKPTHGAAQTASPPPSASQSETDELVASMKETNLVNDSNVSMKRRKQDDKMDLHDHPPLTTTSISMPTPEAKIDNSESSFPLGVSNKGISQSQELTTSTSQHSPPRKSNQRTIAHQMNTTHIPNNNNNNETNNYKNKFTQYKNSIQSRVTLSKKNSIPGAEPSILTDPATTTTQQQQTTTITNHNNNEQQYQNYPTNNTLHPNNSSKEESTEKRDTKENRNTVSDG